MSYFCPKCDYQHTTHRKNDVFRMSNGKNGALNSTITMSQLSKGFFIKYFGENNYVVIRKHTLVILICFSQ